MRIPNGYFDNFLQRIEGATPAYEARKHPHQPAIRQAASGILSEFDELYIWDDLDQEDRSDSLGQLDKLAAILAGLEAIRWIDHSAARSFAVTGIVERVNVSNLVDLIDEYLKAAKRIGESADSLKSSRLINSMSDAAHVLVQVANDFRLMVLNDSYGGRLQRHIDEIEGARGQASELLDRIAQSEDQARRSTQDINALIGGVAAGATSTYYDKLHGDEIEEAEGYRDKLNVWIGVGAIGLALTSLLSISIFQLSDLELSYPALLSLAGIKIPLAFGWIWELRIRSRSFVAARHRAEVAESKRAALLTYSAMKSDASVDAQEALLRAIAPLVFDPGSTGLYEDHRDAVRLGTQSVSIGGDK